MKSRNVVLGLLALVILAVVGLVGLMMKGDPETPVAPEDGTPAETATDPEADDPKAEGLGEADLAESGKASRRASRRRTKWVRKGDGSLVGWLREYGTDRPIADVEVRLTPGQRGPRETLTARSRDDGSFAFATVPNFDAWVLRATAPEPLADAELAGIEVVENQQTDLGVVYLTPGFHVEGIVVTERGVPIGGALVRAIRRSGASGLNILRVIRELPREPVAVDSAVTGKDGKFALTKVPPGTYDMLASAEGYQLRMSKGVIVTPDRKDSRLRFALPTGFSIEGRVVHEGGGNVEGLTITAFPEPSGPDGFLILGKLFASTDDQGHFKLDGLKAAEYIVAVAPENAPITIYDDVRVPGAEFVEIKLSDAAWLEGTISDEEGKGIEGAEVVLVMEGAGAPVIGTTQTDADGKYRLQGLPIVRTQAFVVTAEGYAPYPNDPETMFRRRGPDHLVIEPGRNVKDVQLTGAATVKGKVVEEGSGDPIAGVRVSILSRMVMFGGMRSATTGEDGTFSIDGVSKGTAMLQIWKEGWTAEGGGMADLQKVMRGRGGAEQTDPGEGTMIVVTEAGDVIERTLTMKRGVSVRGRVLTPDGRPLPGARVVLAPAGDSGRGMRDMAAFLARPEPRLTDSEGRFELLGAGTDGSTIVRAEADGYLSGKSEPIQAEAGKDAEGVEIRLGQGGTLEGRVTGEDGKPLAGALVRWEPMAKPGERTVSFGRGGDDVHPTGDDGTYRIDNVPPGVLQVTAAHSRYVEGEQANVKLVAGKVTKTDFKLKLGAVVSGTVLGPDGQPNTGARVRIWNHKIGVWERTNSDGDGKFEFAGLKDGEYQLSATAAGTAKTEDVSVSTGSGPVTLQLQRSYVISGHVRFADGAPAGNARVNAKREGSNSSDGARVEADGSFEFDQLLAGNYTLEVSAGWNWENRPNVISRKLENVAAGTTGMVIEVERGESVTGSVTLHDGSPATGGWVSAHHLTAEGGIDRAKARKLNTRIHEGRFELTGLEGGRIRVTVAVGANRQTLEVDSGATDVRVEMSETGSLKGRVFTPDGSPAAKATVNVNGTGGAGSATTDVGGRFEVKGIGVGDYTVQASMKKAGKSYLKKLDNVKVVAGVTTDRIDVTLEEQQ